MSSDQQAADAARELSEAEAALATKLARQLREVMVGVDEEAREAIIAAVNAGVAAGASLHAACTLFSKNWPDAVRDVAVADATDVHVAYNRLIGLGDGQ